MNPYDDLPDHRFWRRAVINVEPQELNPVVQARFSIGPGDRIGAAGSCFSQHVARELRTRGLSFFDAEPAHPLVPRNRYPDFSFGLFSARYGNVYTARQLKQLIQRAFGRFQPRQDSWRRLDGRYVDPMRPTIQKCGYESVQEIQWDREFHLSRVRKLFEEVDVFIFTLGLTESWEDAVDGTAFPVCPGLFDPDFSLDKYRFCNYSVAEVAEDLRGFVALLREVNSRAKVILTVSPVPIIATYENAHVLAASTYSKSVLRVAAEEAARSCDGVDYFPSYEIVVGSYIRGGYFEDDLRSVSRRGLDHVMRVFVEAYGLAGREDAQVDGSANMIEAVAEAQLNAESRRHRQFAQALNTALCDEDLLDR